MTVDEFVSAFESAIEGVEPNSLAADFKFRTLEQWDSLAALSVLAMIDAECSVQVSGDEMKKCNTIAELFAVVGKKQSA